MVVLVVIEFSDVIFAVDSIPAIFAVTRDPFVVFTSNVFAILGLRSMYFALASVMHKFHYLKYGLSVILTFVGCENADRTYELGDPRLGFLYGGGGVLCWRHR